MKIVAPAGSMSRLEAAIRAGAEEIYLGLKGFGARRSAVNFTMDELKRAIDFAHQRGTRIFLTLNTIMTDNEIDYLYHNLKELYNYGLDAVIVQDIGYASYLHKNFPKLEIHGSTQMTIGNYHEINFLKSLGFKRIVLPRELSFEEIKEIREHTDMELEVFVSGALCISVSGNCYLSSFIGNRSGNRGMCAQPCRKMYKNTCGESGYLISPKDQLMNMEEIKLLKDIGVDSIKIEGRMKNESYVFETVSYYKNLINDVEVDANTQKIFNRGYSKGYFYGRSEALINKDYSFNMGSLVAEIKNKEVKILDDLALGDGISFVSSNYEKISGTYVNKLIAFKNKETKKTVKRGESIFLDFPEGTKYIFKNFDNSLNNEINRSIKLSDKKISISAKLRAKIGESLSLEFYFYDYEDKCMKSKLSSDYIVQQASKKAITEAELEEKISELGETNFILEKIDFDIDENIFIPVSEIKKLKRLCSEDLAQNILKSFKRNLDEDVEEKYELKIEKDSEKEVKLVVIYTNEKQKSILTNNLEKYNISKIYKRGHDIAKQKDLAKHSLDSGLAANFYQLIKSNKKVLLYWNMNIVNSYSFAVLEKIANVYGAIISPELSYEKIGKLAKTKIKKALLIYSKLKGMTIDYDIFDEDEIQIKNAEGDVFRVAKNDFGTEVFLTEALNIINDMDRLKDLCIDEFVIEFTDEKEEEVLKILEQTKMKKGPFKEYNYKKGVF